MSASRPIGCPPAQWLVLVVACGLVLGLLSWIVFSSKAIRAQGVASASKPSAAREKPAGVASRALVSPRTDPAAASGSKEAHWRQLLETGSNNDIAAVLQDMLAAGKPIEAVIDMLESLSQQRPDVAFLVCSQVGRSPSEIGVLMLAVATAWAQRDPAGALGWAGQNAVEYDVPGTISIMSAMLDQVAKDDPSKLLQSVEEILAHREASLKEIGSGQLAGLALDALFKSGRIDLAKQTLEQWVRGPLAPVLDAATFETLAASMAKSSLPETVA